MLNVKLSTKNLISQKVLILRNMCYGNFEKREQLSKIPNNFSSS